MNTKPTFERKVQTLEGVLPPKINAIIKYMATHPEGVTPKMIALSTRVNVNTVKSILPRIANVKKIMRGLYKVVNRGDSPLTAPPDELRDWTFHNCILSCQTSFIPPKPENTTHSFSLINLKFILNQKGLLTCFVSTNQPLNLSSLDLVRGYMLQFISLHYYGVEPDVAVWIRTIEFNRDYSNLRLDGVGCIPLDSLCTQFKAYQKRRGLRKEYKTKIPFKVNDIVDMLTTAPQSIDTDMKLNHQQTQLNELTLATVKNTQLLKEMMELRK